MNQPTLNQPALARLGAACGAVFAIVLTAANGDGSQPFSGPRAIAGIGALTLVVPFIAYLCSVLRAAEGPDGWLAGTALAAGITGIALKLGSGAPELAMQRAHLAAGTPLRAVVDALSDGATVLSLYPLAVFCAAVAIVAFRTRALPRWLGAGAAVPRKPPLTASAAAVTAAQTASQRGRAWVRKAAMAVAAQKTASGYRQITVTPPPIALIAELSGVPAMRWALYVASSGAPLPSLSTTPVIPAANAVDTSQPSPPASRSTLHR